LISYNIRMGSGSFKHCGKTPVEIGSYSFRGKVHICRLLCEYLDIYYVNEFFDPYSWDIYKKKNANEWLFPELPFLKDGKFTITDTPAICEYLIKKSGKL
jgi:glutathione S-transferase